MQNRALDLISPVGSLMPTSMPSEAQVKLTSRRQVMQASANSPDRGRIGFGVGSRERHLRSYSKLNNHRSGSLMQSQKGVRFGNGCHQRKEALNSEQAESLHRESKFVAGKSAHKGQDPESGKSRWPTGEQSSSSRIEQVRWQVASSSWSSQPSSAPPLDNCISTQQQNRHPSEFNPRYQMLVRSSVHESHAPDWCPLESDVIIPLDTNRKHSQTTDVDSASATSSKKTSSNQINRNSSSQSTNNRKPVEKFRDVVQKTIRCNRNSDENREYQTASGSRRRKSPQTRGDTCNNLEGCKQQFEQERWQEEGRGPFEAREKESASPFHSPSSSGYKSCGCSTRGEQQNNDKELCKPGKKAPETHFKEVYRAKNIIWQPELDEIDKSSSASASVYDGGGGDDDCPTSGTDLPDGKNTPENRPVSISSAPISESSPELKNETKLISEGIEALGSDVKSHLIACATAAITANFLVQNNGFRSSVGCSNWTGSSTQPLGHDEATRVYRQPEQVPPYRLPVDGGPKTIMDQNQSLHLSIDKLKMLVERNLVATLVGLYILVSLAVILALSLPYLFNISRGQDTTDVISSSGSMGTTSRKAQKQLMILEGRETFDEPSPSSNQRQQHRYEPQMLPISVELVDKQVVRTGETDEILSTSPATITETYSGKNLSMMEHVTTFVEVAKQNEKRASLSQKDEEKEEKGEEPGFMVGVKGNYADLWRVEHNESCQPVQVSFCSRSLESMLTMDFNSPTQQHLTPNLPTSPRLYESTLLPNQFSRATQSQVEDILNNFEPVVGVKCFALMRLFLCSNFVPKCVPILPKSTPINHSDTGAFNNLSSVNFNKGLSGISGTAAHNSPSHIGKRLQKPNRSRLVPPCKSLCKEAFRKCLFFFEVLSIKLIDPKDCDSLPDSLDPNVCIGKQELEWLGKATEHASCPSDKFRCSSGECISKAWRCDGFADCVDKSDEINCSRCNAATQFYCGQGGLVGSNNQDACIGKDQVCDGVKSCKDGRDERQCLRLSQVVNPQKSNNGHSAPRQLEVWSAIHELWMPVCGAHWSALPMSHEACQALGYSRANTTLFLFGPMLPSASVASNASSALSRLVSPSAKRTLVGVSTKPPADDLPTYQGRFETSSGLSKKRNDDSGSWAEIIEDMDGTIDRPVNRRSLDIVYGRQVGLPQQNGMISYRVNADLMSIDANEAKFKSLTSMLFHGSLSGCMNKPLHMISTVNLVCDNFQCGRSITSYSTRLRSTQHLRLETAYTTSPSARRYGGRVWAPRSSASLSQPLDLDNVTSEPGNDVTSDSANATRVQRLESHDELDDEAEENSFNTVEDDDESMLMMDKIAKQQHLIKDQPISSRLVVGGIESIPGEFPYLAALHGGPDEVFFCGGVLISVNWLLTAAHCVGNRTQPDGWMIKVGITRRIASPTFVKKLKVSKIIKHKDFNLDMAYNNDIALILLEESVEFNQYLRPICLPRANLKLGPDNSKDCVVVGFGKSKFSQDANYLQVAHFANVPIVQNSLCSSWYQEHNVTLSDGMLCAGWAEGKRDACQGDSGSGLFCRYSSTNQFFVAGVVSFGIKCATPKLPGVYTSVPKYVDWIESTTRQHGYPLS